MRAFILLVVTSLWMFALPIVGASAQARRHELALIGTWQLDPARSHYGVGADPRRRERMRCDLRGVLLQCTVASERTNGRRVTANFSVPTTGVQAAVTGLDDVDSVQLHSGPHGIVDATFAFRGRQVFAYRAYRSDDNATLVIVSVDPRTRAALTSVVVYSRAGTR